MKDEIMPYFSYTEALGIAATLLAHSTFPSREAQAVALFDLADQVLFRYEKKRQDYLDGLKPVLASLPEADEASRLALLADFLKTVSNSLPK